ncbi:MAG TPA: GNAT family protein [Bacteroidales bacterium]|nr:GNAT family protein [Bacteroidales bacterium]
MAEVEIKNEKTFFLKPLDVKDSKEIFELIRTEKHVMREWIFGNLQNISINDFTEFLTKEIKIYENYNDSLYSFLESDSLLGVVGFFYSSRLNNKTEIVLWLSTKSKTVQSYSYILKELLEIGFKVKKFNRIGIKVHSDDFVLLSVLRKIGFTNEGTERGGCLNHLNSYSDNVLLSVLQKEYIDQQSFFARADKLFKRTKGKGFK